MIEDYLRSLPLFCELSSADLAKIASFTSLSRYKKGAILFYEEEESPNLIFLKSGLLKFYRIDKFGNEVFLYFANPNEMVSEVLNAKQGQTQCYSNAQFVEDSEILKINFALLKANFLGNNAFLLRLLDEMVQKIKDLQCFLRREMEFDGTSKVAHILSENLELFNRTKKQEIAYMLHIQPATLSRILRRLEKDDLILDTKEGVIIKDAAGLRRVFSKDF